jgi:glutamate--cysteine ligase
MQNINGDFIEIIKKLSLEEEIFKGNFGLEKECNRVNEKGELALTKHPKVFGGKLSHPYITTDFSESQIEMITPICKSVDECYDFLENIYNVVALNIEDEYLWPQSVPPILPEEEMIPIAIYEPTEKGRQARAYREELAKKYGKKKQLVSGIHYNFSFNKEVLYTLYKGLEYKGSFKTFKNQIYLKISRNFIRYAWLFNYLFGASVATHRGIYKECVNKMVLSGESDAYFEYATSMRNSICGYRNLKNYVISYNSVEEYVRDIRALIDSKEIAGAKEYYSPIRLKTISNDHFLETLQEDGIEYLEVRILDINPLLKNGINKHTMHFMHLFMLYLLMREEEDNWRDIHLISQENYDLTASLGRQEGLKLRLSKDKDITLVKWGNKVLDELIEMVNRLGVNQDFYTQLIEVERLKINDISKTPSAIVLKEILGKSYISMHMERAKYYAQMSKAKAYGLVGLEQLELSTQILIKDAIKRGIRFEIVDEKENFIILDNGVKQEYIKQATKTSLDSYITYLIMENKVVTKRVLADHGIRVPQGEAYNDYKQAIKNYKKYKGNKIVIKPKSTNFGIGITIFTHAFTEEEYEAAIKLAFKHDKTVLIEAFAMGKEYRLFVINDQVVAALHRVPANVVGDGVNNIINLVEEKNKNPLRGQGYVKPLEKIKLGEVEKGFLAGQGLSVNDIPGKNEIIFLRENSNISTGGDSIDYTDDIHECYKKVAVKAAKAVGAKICGVDMMVTDIHEFKEENYCIIELNFNPAIHIHCYPSQGVNRQLGDKILDALGF